MSETNLTDCNEKHAPFVLRETDAGRNCGVFDDLELALSCQRVMHKFTRSETIIYDRHGLPYEHKQS